MIRNVLHVGCARKTLKHVEAFFQDGSWNEIRFDIDPNVKPDVIGTLTDLSAVASESVDAIISSHNIEHLFWHEVPVALAEFKRVLTKEGFLWLRCPNLQGLGEMISAGKLLDKAHDSSAGPISPMDIIFGHQAAIKNGNHFMAHKCGFTSEILSQALTEAGFRRAFVRRRRFELFALATSSVASTQGLTDLFSKLWGDRA